MNAQRIIQYMFDPTSARGKLTLLGAVVAFVGLNWLMDSGLEMISASSGHLTSFLVALAVLVCGFTIIIYYFLKAQRHRVSLANVSLEGVRGLIVALSPFSPRGSGIQDAQDLVERLSLPTEKWEHLVGNTNWGPLYVSVRQHQDTLEHCWILYTTGEHGSEKHVDHAKALAKKALGARYGDVQFRTISISDPHDVRETANEVAAIYRSIDTLGLKVEEVVADFTGGTAAMSAGMVLATLPEGRIAKYLRQDKPLVIDGHLRTPEEVKRDCAIALHLVWSNLPADIVENQQG